jgi:hypothetical protein
MGSAHGKGERAGQAPQTEGKISSSAPARKAATWSRRKKERRARHDNEDPACMPLNRASTVRKPLLAYSNIIDK